MPGTTTLEDSLFELLSHMCHMVYLPCCPAAESGRPPQNWTPPRGTPAWQTQSPPALERAPSGAGLSCWRSASSVQPAPVDIAGLHSQQPVHVPQSCVCHESAAVCPPAVLTPAGAKPLVHTGRQSARHAGTKDVGCSLCDAAAMFRAAHARSALSSHLISSQLEQGHTYCKDFLGSEAGLYVPDLKEMTCLLHPWNR